MNTFKLALSATATLILTACGGSGSGGQYSPDTSSHTSVKPNTTVSANASNNHAATTNNGTNNNTHKPPVYSNQNAQATGKVTGHYVAAGSDFQARHVNVGGNDLERIVIDGVPISLKPGHTGPYVTLENINEDIIHTAGTDKDRKVKGLLNKELKHVVYGWVDKYEGLPGNQRYGFVHGVESKSVPQKGKFSYDGHAWMTTDINQKFYQNMDYFDTKVSFVDIDVDFDTKKLKGHVSTLLHGDIALQADIKGSKFEGTHTNGTVTKGAFYGSNAAELAGTFVNVKNPNNAYAGVFGAESMELELQRD